MKNKHGALVVDSKKWKAQQSTTALKAKVKDFKSLAAKVTDSSTSSESSSSTDESADSVTPAALVARANELTTLFAQALLK